MRHLCQNGYFSRLSHLKRLGYLKSLRLMRDRWAILDVKARCTNLVISAIGDYCIIILKQNTPFRPACHYLPVGTFDSVGSYTVEPRFKEPQFNDDGPSEADLLDFLDWLRHLNWLYHFESVGCLKLF